MNTETFFFYIHERIPLLHLLNLIFSNKSRGSDYCEPPSVNRIVVSIYNNNQGGERGCSEGMASVAYVVYPTDVIN